MIRRPMVIMTSSYLGAVVFAYYYGFFISICILLFCCISVNIKDRSFFGNAAVILVVSGYLFGVIIFTYNDNLDIAGEYNEGDGVRVIAVIDKLEEKGESISIKVKLKEIDGKKLNKNYSALIKISGNIKENNYKLGDIVVVQGRVAHPLGRKNPGCFDYALYLKSIGIDIIINAEEIIITGKNIRPLQCRIYDKRLLFSEKLSLCMEEQSAKLVEAILFGDKQQLDEEVLETFQKNGTAHILAVSGLHMGLIYLLFSHLWIWKKRRVFLTVVLFIFYCYMAIASFSPSVVRASIMIFLHSFAVVTNRRYDMISAAFFAALCMMTMNPMSIFNAGFQLSFIAVLSISMIMPVVKRFYAGILLCSVTVQLGIWPISVYIFNRISVITIFLNVPIVFLLSIMLPIGLLIFLMTGFEGQLFLFMANILDKLCLIMVDMNRMAEMDGLTAFDVTSPDLRFVLSYYLLLFVFMSEEGRRYISRKKVKAIIVILFTSVVLSTALWITAGNHFKQADIVFVDVGQGDCVHVRSESGNYIFDGGGTVNYNIGKNTLKPYFLKNGVKSIDGAFVSHLHTDHYKGIVELCNEGMVKKLYVYEANKVREKEIIQETGLDKNDICYIHGGQRIILDENLSINILWPYAYAENEYKKMIRNSEDENQLSTILKVNINEKSFVLTADIDDECMEKIAGEFGGELKADIIKVPHHGSKYSWNESFVEYTSPEYAVIQVGKNNFGHPDNSVIENYLKKGIIIYRTDLDGAIVFTIDKGRKLNVQTIKGATQ